MSMNLNDRVSVRLTATGLRVLDENEYEMGLPKRHRRMSITDGNVWTGQLWELMQEFGRCLRMGIGEGPFERNEIQLVSSVESQLAALDKRIAELRGLGSGSELPPAPGK